MKNIITKLLIVLGSIAFIGCGNGEGSFDKTIHMVIDQNYTVSGGDIITPTSEDANVTLTLIFEDGSRVAKLIKGTATLEKK